MVKIPASVERLLAKPPARRGATRLKLRVVTKRYGKLTHAAPVADRAVGARRRQAAC